jgi:hypothetical protein
MTSPTAHPSYGRPRDRDTSHLLSYGLEWNALDDEAHGSGAYAHPPSGGCATGYEDGAWLALHPGGRRVEGRAADENAARRAAIDALGGKVDAR